MRVVAIIAAVLLLTACSGDQLTGATVKEVADQAKQDIDETVEKLRSENERLQERIDGFKETASKAANQTEETVKELSTLRTAMDSLAEEKSECATARDSLEEENERLKKRVRVLERWVDACEEEFGELA